MVGNGSVSAIGVVALTVVGINVFFFSLSGW